MPIAYKWRPIEDLGADPKSLTDGELESFKRVWANQKTELIQFRALEDFEQRLRREWSIETGAIEDVYTLDRGVTKTLIVAALIPHGAGRRDPERIARIIQDHYDALDGMFGFVSGHRQLTTGYIKQLHDALLRNQDSYTVVDQFGQVCEKPLDKGRYKDLPNSPTRPDGSVHEFCPPEHAASEMDELIRLHDEHKSRDVPPEVEAAWLHHRFAQIHPFQDGNGRVARAIASLVFIKSGWFPLIVRTAGKARYLDALEKADAGDLRPLVAMFVEMQRNAVIQATEVAYDIRPITSVHESIAAVRDQLLAEKPKEQWRMAEETANVLLGTTAERFGRIGPELTGGTGIGFGLQRAFERQPGYDDVRTAVVREVGHVADFAEYGALVELTLNVRRNDILTLLFYAVGPRYRGIIGIVGYVLLLGVRPVLIKDGAFLINYEEDLATAQKRFSTWLERVIVEGLNEWRKTL
jgi:fido (protein-threonine AMPylation protein)